MSSRGRARAWVTLGCGLALAGCLPRVPRLDAGSIDTGTADTGAADTSEAGAAEAGLDAVGADEGVDAPTAMDADLDAEAATALPEAGPDASDATAEEVFEPGGIELQVRSSASCVGAFAPVVANYQLRNAEPGATVLVELLDAPTTGLVAAADSATTSALGVASGTLSLRAALTATPAATRAVTVRARSPLRSGRATFTVQLERCRGTPDLAFRRSAAGAMGDTGVLAVPPLGSSGALGQGVVTAVAVEPLEGRVLVSGVAMATSIDWASGSDNSQLMLARFSSDGAVDATLAGGPQPGIVVHDLSTGVGGKEFYRDLRAEPGGGALIAGEASGPSLTMNPGAWSDPIVVHITATGQLDTQEDGRAGYGERPRGAGLRTGAARVPPDVSAVSLLAGSPYMAPASDLNDAAQRLVRWGPRDLVLASQQVDEMVPFGRLQMLLATLTDTGDLEPPAQVLPLVLPLSGGRRAINPRAAAVSPEGDLYVGGELDANYLSSAPSRAFLARVRSDRTLAPEFNHASGVGGASPAGVVLLASPMITSAPTGTASNAIYAIAVDARPPGPTALLVAGYIKPDSSGGTMPWVARYDARTGAPLAFPSSRRAALLYGCGHPDPTTINSMQMYGAFRALALRPDGTFYAAGHCVGTPATTLQRSQGRELGSEVLVVAYDASGEPRAGFGNEGTNWPGALHFALNERFDPDAPSWRGDRVEALTFARDGALLAAGTTVNEGFSRGFVMRLVPDAP